MKDFLKVYWPLVLVAVIGLIIALRFVDPAPPRNITLATGGQGGAYFAYGERYRNLLAEHGVEVELISTAGSIENLRLLQDGDADAALLQGGTAVPEDSEWLQTLGGLFYEPFWVFSRRDPPAGSFRELAGRRVAIGPEGSGTRDLALRLQAEYDKDWDNAQAVPISGSEAADALLKGDIQAAVFTAGISAPYVERLLTAKEAELVPFALAPALERRNPALAQVTLLRGVINVGELTPPQDVPMVAPVAQLGVSRDLHPAIQAILLEAAEDIHASHSLLATANTFPNGQMTDLELSPEAERYYEDGPSALRRWFPFGVANFLERAWVLAIPLITLLIPLVRMAPPLYRWRTRRKIYVWYDDLRELEARGRAAESRAERDLVRQHLEQLQEEIGRLEVPLSYTDDLYRLRNHVAFVNHLLGNPDTKNRVDPMIA